MLPPRTITLRGGIFSGTVGCCQVNAAIVARRQHCLLPLRHCCVDTLAVRARLQSGGYVRPSFRSFIATAGKLLLRIPKLQARKALKLNLSLASCYGNAFCRHKCYIALQQEAQTLLGCIGPSPKRLQSLAAHVYHELKVCRASASTRHCSLQH